MPARSLPRDNPLLQSLLAQLLSGAQQRPDLGIEGPTATYLGRLVPIDPAGAESRSLLESVLSRPQDNPPDEGFSEAAVSQLLKASPLLVQGVISSKIRQAQGRTPALGGGRSTFNPSPTGPNVESLRRSVLASPGFEKFRQKLINQLRQRYGEVLTLFRGIAPGELASLKKGVIPDLAGFTLDKEIAANLASPGGAIIKGKAPLESILFRPPHTGVFGLEKEIVANPRKFTNLSLESRIPSSKDLSNVLDLNALDFNPFLPAPLAPEHQLINQSLRELFSKEFK